MKEDPIVRRLCGELNELRYQYHRVFTQLASHMLIRTDARIHLLNEWSGRVDDASGSSFVTLDPLKFEELLHAYSSHDEARIERVRSNE